MSSRAREIRFRGEVTQRDQALQQLDRAGDAALVRRGPLRSLVMMCPDGCGDVLTVNLDKRAGKAWRVYGVGEKVSVYPSVWRTGGCHSHFVIRAGHILWCDRYERTERVPEMQPGLTEALLKVLPTEHYAHFLDLADQIDAVPWEVSDALDALVEQHKAERGDGDEHRSFRRKAIVREPEEESRSWLSSILDRLRKLWLG